jgi:hypothetical protein
MISTFFSGDHVAAAMHSDAAVISSAPAQPAIERRLTHFGTLITIVYPRILFF